MGAVNLPIPVAGNVKAHAGHHAIEFHRDLPLLLLSFARHIKDNVRSRFVTSAGLLADIEPPFQPAERRRDLLMSRQRSRRRIACHTSYVRRVHVADGDAVAVHCLNVSRDDV